MGLMQKMNEYLIKNLQNYLEKVQSPNAVIHIQTGANHQITCAKNRIWYDGKSKQLSELYKQLDDVPDTMFWKAESTAGQEIRKIHIGLPALIVDVITNIVLTDYNGVEFTSDSDSTLADIWANIEKDNEFAKILKQCVTDLGIVGDGAFKVTYDEDISNYPIIEWVGSENVEFVYKRGRIREVVFKTEYIHNRQKYNFFEIYGYGYIKYELYNNSQKSVPFGSIPQTGWVDSPGVVFDKNIIWAVPVIYGTSSFKGRGKGLIEAKEDDFDSLDEVWSQWMDALRSGRTKEYIPEGLIPRNKKNGQLLKPNPFDHRFTVLADDMSENGGNKIHTETPTIQHESYLSTYITALDLCLQGIISPSTLGIDVKKLDNADAQREKEKATMYTRKNFIEVLNNAIPMLVVAALKAYGEIKKVNDFANDVVANVKFGEYANPSFESQVETIGKARQSGVMSVKTSVDELYGDSKDEEWKEKEVKRIKEEQGISIADEKSEYNDLGGFYDS